MNNNLLNAIRVIYGILHEIESGSVSGLSPDERNRELLNTALSKLARIDRICLEIFKEYNYNDRKR